MAYPRRSVTGATSASDAAHGVTRRARVAAETVDRGRERREHLLSVALRVFAAEGFRGASTSRIARLRGSASPGLFHATLRSATCCLSSCNGRSNSRCAAWPATAHGGDLLRLDDRARSSSRGRPHLIRLFIVLADKTASDHPAHAWFRERYARVLRWWEEGFVQDRARGALPRHADPHLIARQVVARSSTEPGNSDLLADGKPTSGPAGRYVAAISTPRPTRRPGCASSRRRPQREPSRMAPTASTCGRSGEVAVSQRLAAACRRVRRGRRAPGSVLPVSRPPDSEAIYVDGGDPHANPLGSRVSPRSSNSAWHPRSSTPSSTPRVAASASCPSPSRPSSDPARPPAAKSFGRRRRPSRVPP